MEKHTKTLENQDLNDFLLETLTWIDYHWQLLIPNNKDFSLLTKNMLFPRELLYR